jgi:alkanesulfonate monooxygenase SsuD/methylene tetrahydromethanopterin reductase-like flavin-dependent oxidoreductase (luciferase family)
MAPSPALFLTAATQRTRRIRLGPLVYLLPLYDPLRLIEEVAMLDQLSGGRRRARRIAIRVAQFRSRSGELARDV